MPSNLVKLAIYKMSLDAIPANGGVADGVAFLSDPGAVSQAARMAKSWVNEAIRLVRSCPGGDRLGDDEVIAGLLLDQIEARRQAARKRLGDS